MSLAMEQRSEKAVLADLLAYVNREFGFRLDGSATAKITGKIKAMALPACWPDLAAFRSSLLAGDAAAHDLLVARLTVHHTFFFREADHFYFMQKEIQRRGMRQATVWSAAGSSGEEAYSIAISLLDIGLSDFKVLVSDVDAKVLHKVNQGIYDGQRLEGLNPLQLKRYFRGGPGGWTVAPELRSHVVIKRINLMTPVRFQVGFDFIYCRNMFIYFDEASRLAAVDNLRENLKVGGVLFVGFTEAFLEVPRGFAKIDHAAYRRIA